MQRNWIGKSHGFEMIFPMADPGAPVDSIKVFTTRQDTIYGATFMLIAAEHPLVMELVKGKPMEKEVAEFVDKVKKQDKLMRTSDYYEKEGVFLGSYCLNPVTGMKMPIYAANFVLADYGTGCVMAVPTHDQRDFEFAKKYSLPLIVVIQNPGRAARCRNHDGGLRGRGHSGQLRPVQRPGKHESARCDSRLSRIPGKRHKNDAVPPPGLGHFPPALLGSADTHCLLR